jgi:hypothetical protein
MYAAHKKSPANRQAILDDVADEEQRLLGGMQGLLVRWTRREIVHTKMRMVASGSHEDRNLVPTESDR